jgi:hypothetical protein
VLWLLLVFEGFLMEQAMVQTNGAAIGPSSASL